MRLCERCGHDTRPTDKSGRSIVGACLVCGFGAPVPAVRSRTEPVERRLKSLGMNQEPLFDTKDSR